MAHITRFSVTGLGGSRREYSQDLDRHVNIFFGRNGSGKTSLLRILDSAMNGDASLLLAVPFIQATVSIYSDQYKQEFRRTLSKEKLIAAAHKRQAVLAHYGAQRALFDDKDMALDWEELDSLPPDSKKRWRHLFLPISRMYTVSRNTPRQQLDYSPAALEEVLNEQFSETLKSLWTSYSAEVNAEVRAAQSQGLANILKAVLNPATEATAAQELDTTVAYRRLESFLARQQASGQLLPSQTTFQKRYGEDLLLRLIVADMDLVERRIAAATAPRALLQELIGRMFSGGKSVQFDDDGVRILVDEQKELSVGNLSSGEKQVLRLLIEALRVDINALLIDEPELSMHVDWQRELIASMRSLNSAAQIIVATHSPEIMADIDDSLIFHL